MKTLKLFPLLLLSGAVISTSAQAGYHMTAFGGTAGFDQIMAQDYTSANDLLKVQTYLSDRYARLANLCVSQLKSNQPELALKTCDRAVAVAPGDLTSLLNPLFHKRAEVMTHLYSNRGVVRAVTGDAFGAREDFERALSLDGSNDNARLNLDYVAAGDLAQQDD